MQQGFLKNHGTSIALDPLDGSVYVAWRVFYENWPLMVISRSPNGKTFLPPSPITHEWPGKNLSQIVQQLKGSKLQPLDQLSNQLDMPPTVRALAIPPPVAGVPRRPRPSRAGSARRHNLRRRPSGCRPRRSPRDIVDIVG